LPRWIEPSLDGNPVLWREWHRQRPSRWMRIVWGLYAAGALGFSVLAVVVLLRNGRPASDTVSIVVLFQVAIGLLLLTVTTATGLAEERTRGTLDVLLATPLATSDIVVGKWWGAFRRIPLLGLLPALLAAIVAADHGRYEVCVVFPALVLSSGALVISLALALATWIARLGRVLTVAVMAFLAASIGWFVLIVVLAPNGPYSHGNLPAYAAMGSIGLGAGWLCEMTTEVATWPGADVAILFWLTVYTGGAFGLTRLTLRTFDRCLGRMPERQRQTGRTANEMRREA
jgi:ABC-type transport system involved in multi-copper enzyme maturation permease subunit